MLEVVVPGGDARVAVQEAETEEQAHAQARSPYDRTTLPGNAASPQVDLHLRLHASGATHPQPGVFAPLTIGAAPASPNGGPSPFAQPAVPWQGDAPETPTVRSRPPTQLGQRLSRTSFHSTMGDEKELYEGFGDFVVDGVPVEGLDRLQLDVQGVASLPAPVRTAYLRTLSLHFTHVSATAAQCAA